jgi:hypothetical protein
LFILERIVLPQKDVVDLFADESSKAQEFAVNPVQHGLKKVALTGIFAIEQLQQLRK